MPRVAQSLQDSSLTIDGLPILGAGTEDICTISEPNEAQTVQGTADGFTLVAGNRLRYRMATISVAQGTPGWQILTSIFKVGQQLDELATVVFVWSIRSGGLRVTYTCGNASFTRWPDEVWQRTQQIETWELVLPDVFVVRTAL